MPLLWCVTLVVMTSSSSSARPSDPAGEHETEVGGYGFPVVPRAAWGARPPTQRLPLPTPVPYVTLHHSHSPPACRDLETCARAMRTMQRMHMDDNHWWDVGYSFAVGSDGAAYEGRGWTTLGAHAKYFNTVSIGICLIGDWSDKVPPAAQLKTAQALIAAGVQLGYIRPDYRLVGHRQVRATECPGQALYDEIKTWHHHSNFPATPRDLLDIPEIPDSVKQEIRNNTLSAAQVEAL